MSEEMTWEAKMMSGQEDPEFVGLHEETLQWRSLSTPLSLSIIIMNMNIKNKRVHTTGSRATCWGRVTRAASARHRTGRYHRSWLWSSRKIPAQKKGQTDAQVVIFLTLELYDLRTSNNLNAWPTTVAWRHLAHNPHGEPEDLSDSTLIFFLIRCNGKFRRKKNCAIASTRFT